MYTIHFALSLSPGQYDFGRNQGGAMGDNRDEIGLAEAAQLLRLPYQSAHRLVLVGVLAGVKRSGRWFVRRADATRLSVESAPPPARRVPGSEGQK
jgi:hypothetical protein